jgi:hypothetical protein
MNLEMTTPIKLTVNIRSAHIVPWFLINWSVIYIYS